MPITSVAFAAAVSSSMQTERHALATRWLDRLEALLPVEPQAIFPSADLLDHIPSLIEQIAIFLVVPEDDITANTFVLTKARELGVLRHSQRASVHQLLREYELLRNILQSFVLEQSEQLELSPVVSEVIPFLRRIDQAIGLLTQVTVDTFVDAYTATITEQTRRLEAFNRMLGHELRQPLGVLHMGVRMLRVAESEGEARRREQALGAVERNLTRLTELVETITKLSRARAVEGHEGDLGVQRVSVSTVATEVARQLREMATARGVEVRVAANLPDVTTDVGQLELILTNLLSNAIKYSDQRRIDRFVEVAPGPAHVSNCSFCVRDNGIGMDAQQLRNVFTPFYRGHADRDSELQAEGVGLGLAIVRDCVTALGGDVSVEAFPGAGATFTVTLPAASSGSASQ